MASVVPVAAVPKATNGVRPANWLHTAIKRVRQRLTGLHDMPARMALRFTNLRPARRYLAERYKASLAAHLPALPIMVGLDREIIDGLHRNGVFVTTLTALGFDSSDRLLRTASAMAERFADEARRKVAEGVDFTVVPPDAISRRPAVFRWGLQRRLLAIAEAYLELPVAFDGVSLNYTVADGREVSTRRWHRDWEDRRMLKVAVYLNDVDEDGGPFQMVKCREAVQDDASGFTYEIATDRELEQRLGDFHDRIQSCTGPAGTVVFTDTAGFFHRGKPATATDRRALFYSYFARTPRHPFFCERSGLSRRDLRKLLPGLNEQQRAAVQWRKSLPFLVRMIPPARL